MKICAVAIVASASAALAQEVTTEESRAKAAAEFPDLSNPSSVFAKAYAAEEAQLRASQVGFFSDDNWPLMLAYRVATKLGISGGSAANTAVSPQVTMSSNAVPSNSVSEGETTAAQAVSPHILTLKGENGSGSGFILWRQGKCYLVTNAHVIDENENITVASIGKEFPLPRRLLVSKTRDVVLAEVTGFKEGLEVETDFSQVRIGDATISLGNSSGAGVARLTKGKVLGIGNDLIETDAAYVQGNSGSPIVHQTTGKVLGVVTYVEKSPQNKLVAESDLKEFRHFAHRIDNIPASDLVLISSDDFMSGGKLVRAINTRNENIKKAIDATKGQNTFGEPLASIVYRELGFSGSMPFVLGGKFVGLEDIPEHSTIRGLHPVHRKQLHHALTERMELIVALGITSNIIYREFYVRIDEAGTLKQINVPEHVRQAVAVSK
jgi:S1-C subfamily serine protease